MSEPSGPSRISRVFGYSDLQVRGVASSMVIDDGERVLMIKPGADL